MLSPLEYAVHRANMARSIPTKPKIVPVVSVPKPETLAPQAAAPKVVIGIYDALQATIQAQRERIIVLEYYIKRITPPGWDVKRPHIREVVAAVARHYKLLSSDITGRRRTWNVVRPRQVAMYLAKVLTRHTMPVIGRSIGDRDHSTVCHAVRRIEYLRSIDPELDEAISLIEQTLRHDAESPQDASSKPVPGSLTGAGSLVDGAVA